MSEFKDEKELKQEKIEGTCGMVGGVVEQQEGGKRRKSSKKDSKKGSKKGSKF